MILKSAPALRGNRAKRWRAGDCRRFGMADNVPEKLPIKARDEIDQRVVKLTLTDEGIAALVKAPKPAKGLLPEAILHLDEESLLQLDRGLQGLLNSIRDLDDGFGLLPLPFTM